MTCNLHFLNHDIKDYLQFPDMTLQIIFLPSVMTLVSYLPKHDITNDLPFSKYDITNDLPVPKHDIINTDNWPFPEHDIINTDNWPFPEHDIINTDNLPFPKHDIINTDNLPFPKHDIINTDNLPFPKHDITYNIGSSRQQQGFDSDGSFITVLQGFRHYIYFFKNLLFQRFLTNTKIPECLESKPT